MYPHGAYGGYHMAGMPGVPYGMSPMMAMPGQMLANGMTMNGIPQQPHHQQPHLQHMPHMMHHPHMMQHHVAANGYNAVASAPRVQPMIPPPIPSSLAPVARAAVSSSMPLLPSPMAPSNTSIIPPIPSSLPVSSSSVVSSMSLTVTEHGSNNGSTTTSGDAESLLSSFLDDSKHLERKLEVARIHQAFKFNPMDIMGLPLDATTAEINKQYRELSLLVHPDKCAPDYREDAQKAFNLLTGAKNDLLDEVKRGVFNDMVTQARQKIIGIKETEAKNKRKEEYKILKDKDPAAAKKLADQDLPDVLKLPEFNDLVKNQLKELLIDKEWRTRQLLKMASKEEGLAATFKEQKDQERAVKLATEKEWEDGRENRVGSWRSWQGGSKRKTLLRMPKLLVEDDSRTYIKRVKQSGGIVAQGKDREENDD